MNDRRPLALLNTAGQIQISAEAASFQIPPRLYQILWHVPDENMPNWFMPVE